MGFAKQVYSASGQTAWAGGQIRCYFIMSHQYAGFLPGFTIYVLWNTTVNTHLKKGGVEKWCNTFFFLMLTALSGSYYAVFANIVPTHGPKGQVVNMNQLSENAGVNFAVAVEETNWGVYFK